MILYLAASDTAQLTYLPGAGLTDLLCSYHLHNNRGAILKFHKRGKGYNLFLDSGAFSAWSAGVSVNIDHYCNYVKSVKPTYYAGLDVIGSAEGTLKNQLYMEKVYKLKPLPTFHTGEDEKYLHYYMKYYDYICLGGMVQYAGLQEWLDKTWKVILKHKPNLRVHGFGLTDYSLMIRYPWYSVDSSSFMAGRRFGRISLIDEEGKIFDMRVEEYMEQLIKEGRVNEKIRKNLETRQDLQEVVKITDIESGKAYVELGKKVTRVHTTGFDHLKDKPKTTLFELDNPVEKEVNILELEKFATEYSPKKVKPPKLSGIKKPPEPVVETGEKEKDTPFLPMYLSTWIFSRNEKEFHRMENVIVKGTLESTYRRDMYAYHQALFKTNYDREQIVKEVNSGKVQLVIELGKYFGEGVNENL